MATDMDREKFIEEIDKIESVIRGLASKKEDEAKEATRKADELLAIQEKNKKTEKKKYPKTDNTGVNRSVINQKAFDELGRTETHGPNITAEMDQAGFMSVMEQDAKERSERKKQAEKDATVWKEKGNIEFKNGNFDKAVEHYSMALSIFKDTTVFWTNRAQAYIKLEKFEKALTDCDWATRVFENCLKAYIHQGRAYLGLKQYEKAIESYERAKQIEPKKASIIMEYIKEVEIAKKTDAQEESAKKFIEKGGWESEGLVATLQKLNKPDQLPIFYSGGLMILAKMKDSNERTLFRREGGLNLIQEHPLISKYFNASLRSLSRDELDVCAATFSAMTAACVDNEENQKQLLDIPDLPAKMLKFMDTSVKHTKYLKESAASFLLQISETETGRNKIVNSFDVIKLTACLFKLMMLQSSVGVTAVSLLNNIALHKRFKHQIREEFDTTVLAFENLMIEEPKNLKVLPTCVCTVTNLCSDSVLRKRLSNRKDTWDACLKCIKCHLGKHTDALSSDILHALLGLLSNLTFDTSTNQYSFQQTICSHCFELLKQSPEPRLHGRSMAVLGHILPGSSEAVDFICELGGVLRFLQLLKDGSEELVKGCIKCLTSCTQHNQTAREQVCNFKSGTKLIQKLLKHDDEVVVGNAALCLDHCVLLPGVAAKLGDTDIMMDLLVLARDGNRIGVQKNCAILIAKLCKADNKHLEKLRELDGLGILHNLMGKVTL